MIAVGSGIIGDHYCTVAIVESCGCSFVHKLYSLLVVCDGADGAPEGHAQHILCIMSLLKQDWYWFDGGRVISVNYDSARVVQIILGHCCLLAFGNGGRCVQHPPR